MKSGYIYVLIHPSDPNLYKIGITIRKPEQRLSQHNSDPTQITGHIVKETGQKWELKEYHPVPDPYYAESAFWASTMYGSIPFRRGVEVESMSWKEVEKALEVAKNAGLRPAVPDQPDHVYAYTAQIRKRLEGRGISLIGQVRSIISGRSDFRCINGHQWRTTPRLVGEGEGCPKCGIGECDPNEIIEMIKAGVVCLLTHPDKPGYVNIGVGYGTLGEVFEESPWGDWEVHRYLNVDETGLAEKIIWGLLSEPLPHDREPIKKRLDIAEDAFRKLIYVMREEIANEERRRDHYEDLPELI
jgi:hypothetical protein